MHVEGFVIFFMGYNLFERLGISKSVRTKILLDQISRYTTHFLGPFRAQRVTLLNLGYVAAVRTTFIFDTAVVLSDMLTFLGAHKFKLFERRLSPIELLYPDFALAHTSAKSNYFRHHRLLSHGCITVDLLVNESWLHEEILVLET